MVAGSHRVLWASVVCAAAVWASGVPSSFAGLPRTSQATGDNRNGLATQVVVLPESLESPLSTSVVLEGTAYILDLYPHSLRARDFRVVVQGEDGQLRDVDPPLVRTFRGSVAGRPHSSVVASVMDGALSATIKLETASVWHVRPAPGDGRAQGQHVVYRSSDVPPGEWDLGEDVIYPPSAEAPVQSLAEPRTLRTAGLTIAEIAFDADAEFYRLHNSSIAQTVHDIESVMNNVAAIYEQDLGITYEVSTIIVRTGEPDPYTSTDNAGLIAEFRTEWNLNMQSIHRDIAHLMTGKTIDGTVIGSSYLGTICDVCGNGSGYGFSQSLFSDIMPLRTALTAHELGHNWGAEHCDGDPDCYLMCSQLNGCAHDYTRFGSRSISDISAKAASVTCLSTLAPPRFSPFCDSFTDLSSAKWSYNAIASLSGSANDPPSPPYALLLDTRWADCVMIPALDEIRSNFIQLGGLASARLSYYTQHAGGSWTAGSQLLIEYFNDDLAWVEINRVTSDGTTQASFDFWSHSLPMDALHDEFRVRFRLIDTVNQADWFLDDVAVSHVEPGGPTLFVRADAPGGGDGSGWDTALGDLQDALAAAICARGTVEEIWVTAGSYFPDRGTGNRSATFELASGVAVYGGFAGWEISRSQRDPVNNPTILSGDIGTPLVDVDNSYHVVTATGTNASAVLDGFTITGGLADGSPPGEDRGAGIYNASGGPTIRDCVIEGNKASQGAGVYNSGAASPTFRNCAFIANYAIPPGSGGALQNAGGSILNMEACVLLGNAAGAYGGGVYNSNCIVNLNDSILSGNSGLSGGGVHNLGGTVYLTNCTLAGNVATQFYGGLSTLNGSATLVSCILWDNDHGGAPGETAQLGGSPISIGYSCVEGWTGSLGGEGNRGDNPGFADADGDDDTPGTLDDDLRLTELSPAVDQGDPSLAPEPGAVDLDGLSRVLCSRVEMGAYEYGLMGDFDCNGLVNLSDFGPDNWPDCMTGPESEGYDDRACAAFDFDIDGDVDLRDFMAFQTAYPGSP